MKWILYVVLTVALENGEPAQHEFKLSFDNAKHCIEMKKVFDVGVIIPELEGKLDGLAIRVPVPDVSLLDLSIELETDTTIEEVVEVFEKEKKLYGILCVSHEPLVSVDYIGNSCSAIVDVLSSMMINKRLLKLIAFYDNEYGYCCRVLDLLEYLAKKLPQPTSSK